MDNFSPTPGLLHPVEQLMELPAAEKPRTLSQAWLTDVLLEETRRVWSPYYGRDLSTDEAAEILGNVKRFAEMLLKLKKVRREK
jgi:hypothetical protein